MKEPASDSQPFPTAYSFSVPPESRHFPSYTSGLKSPSPPKCSYFTVTIFCTLLSSVIIKQPFALKNLSCLIVPFSINGLMNG